MAEEKDKEKLTLAFHMDVDTAEEAFALFDFYGADTQEKRIAIIKQMAEQGYDIAIFTTKRTPEQIANDYAKHGEVLYIKPPEEKDGEERLQDKDYEFCPNCERPLWDCACNNDDASSS